jgi:hypothetical protein
MTPYRRALADAAFRRAVEGHYRGRHPVLDVLSWFEGDGGGGDDGAPSPYEGLEARRAALYRADADRAEVQAVARLLAERDEERTAVRSAVAAAEQRAAPVRPRDTGEQAADAVRTKPRAWPVLLLVVPAVVAAFAAGSALGPVIGQRAVPVPTIAAAQVPDPVVLRPTGGGALAVFDRFQVRADVPTATPEGDLVEPSFRRLIALTGTGVVLYGARTTEGQVCLVAITVDAHISATCSRDAEFRVTPFSIDVSVTKDPTTDDPRDTRTEIAATWSYDGSLRAGAVS